MAVLIWRQSHRDIYEKKSRICWSRKGGGECRKFDSRFMLLETNYKCYGLFYEQEGRIGTFCGENFRSSVPLGCFWSFPCLKHWEGRVTGITTPITNTSFSYCLAGKTGRKNAILYRNKHIHSKWWNALIQWNRITYD